MEYNLADLFESVADTIGDREALVCGEARLTFAELDRRANRVAHHLAAEGVRPGDHVGIQLYNGPEYVETLLGVLKIRAVAVNVNYRYVAEELAYLCADADLVALVHDTEFTPRVLAVLPRLPKLRHRLVVGGGPGGGSAEAPAAGAAGYEEALAAQSAERDFGPRSGDDVYIIYTGGTTGMPKGVMWRHEDLFFAGMGGGDPVGEPVSAPGELAERLAGRQPLVMFPVAPLMHGAAQLATFIGFFQGQRVVLIRRFNAADVLRTIERERVNTINVVGDAMARPLAEALDGPLAGTDLSSLFVISSAGAILSGAVRESLERLLPNTFLIDSFGASETGYNGSGTAGSTPDAGLRFAMTPRTAVLDPAELRPLEPGSDRLGRVAQRGHVPLGYYNDPELTAKTFVEIDGERWVLLGDVARVEADGTISVLGRGSQCINTGGEKVYPEEVEAALKSHPAVFDAVVAGVPDPSYGERVAAVLQARPDAGDRPDADVQRHCRERLAGYKVPRVITWVDAIERSPSGKPDYRWARSVAGDAAAAAATPDGAARS
jgi:acyl-CoA synthetase (AMP-forming)/AMP-acid ligase II